MSDQKSLTGGAAENAAEVVEIDRFQACQRAERLPVLKTYKLFIDGQFPRTESGRYYPVTDPQGQPLANICQASRKDLRNSVSAARKAFSSWSERSAYNRGQIVYRIAEMLEGRRKQFIDELQSQGSNAKNAAREVDASVDRLIYYAGWSDKYQQVFSTVNPVNSSHFNFSVPEPMGVVTIVAPPESSLAGLVSCTAPVIVGGNSCVVLASEQKPLCAVTFSEVLHSADLPAGVINILTGKTSELISHLASHMDVNAIAYYGDMIEELKTIQTHASLNIKRVIEGKKLDWLEDTSQDPYQITAFQETKTTWHPIGQ